MKKYFFCALMLGSLLTTVSSFAIDCDTVQHCQAGACECMISPSSAYDRYFNFQFDEITRRHDYICEFSSTPSHFVLDLSRSVLPEGSHIDCKQGCEQFPARFILRTQHMTHTVGVLKVKYFVPASDMPSVVKATCFSSV